METLSYDIEINASKIKIWKILWSPETYSQWTHYFAPSCTFKTDWEIGGKTYFLDQKGDGMVSTIGNLDEPNEVTFNHLGMVKDGKEDTESREIKDWSGAPERYFLIELENGSVKLQVELQMSKDMEETMNYGFTKGLEIVKKLAEQS